MWTDPKYSFFNLVSTLNNESDVEQKLIMPLLCQSPPFGADINVSQISTKKNLREFKIDKGIKNGKIYFPDYVISFGCYPIMVIEAKSPKESLAEGWREARLYANEINCIFPQNINPAKIIFACNGNEIWYGYTDQEEPIAKVEVASLSIVSNEFKNMIDFISINSIESIYHEVCKNLKPIFMKKPKRLVGGITTQNEELPKNEFGESISIQINTIFNPTSRRERNFIVNNGYIESNRNRRHKSDIDTFIKAALSNSDNNSLSIQNTRKPHEIIQAFHDRNIFNGQLMLLIGSVGVGKTTFVDYLQMANALPKSVKNNLVWVRLDLNNAPVNNKEIYTWIRNNIIKELQNEFSQDISDYESIEFIEKLYSVEINKYNKIEGSLKKKISEEEYLRGKIDLIEKSTADLHQTTLAYTRFLVTEKDKVLIIVFDNCDKKQREEQLLMFQVAQWAKDTFRALILLPLRDETYDHYKDHPPLDTAIKNLSFRIDPPDFKEVLSRRVQLALEKFSPEGGVSKNVMLSNGMQVQYKQNERSEYLLAMLESVLRHDKDIRRLITGLSGRNIRRALEIFLGFCSSSYISNDIIFKIRNNKDKEHEGLPLYIATQALMRSTRRFYDSDDSYIKNLFEPYLNSNKNPIYFLRLIILRWLKNSSKEDRWIKSSGRKGYMPLKLMIDELQKIGFEEKNIIEQVQYLTKSWCISTEDFRIENITEDLLITLAPAGYVHLDLVENNLTYLSTVAEDTTICDESVASSIKERIYKSEEQLKLSTVVENAKTLIEYLSGIREKQLECYNSYQRTTNYDTLTDLQKSTNVIQKAHESLINPDWSDFIQKYNVGMVLDGTITNLHKTHGIFVKISEFNNITGLIHKDNLPSDYLTNIPKFSKWGKINVEILYIEPLQEKLYLKWHE